MKIIDKKLKETADIIDRNFSKVHEQNRAEISTDILPHIRHFCEAFMYKVYDEENSVDLYQTQENLTAVRKFFKDNYYDIWKFHSLLDASVGHMDYGSMQSEALIIKYIPKLIGLKDFLYRNYGLKLLGNINKYPLDLDNSLTSFYEKILVVLLSSKCETQSFTRNQFFIRKRSMRYINGHVFYEYVFDVSDDKASKYNTFVCYSLKNIKFDYDVKLLLANKNIGFLNTTIPIKIIYDYEYSIRPCTFKNLLYLINGDPARCERNKEYLSLMRFIKRSGMSLSDIICCEEDINLVPKGYYTRFIKHLKEYVNANKPGSNTIRFLLSEMRNSAIKAQTYKPYGEMPRYNERFTGLRIHLGTKAFELMPFAFSPRQAKPSLYALFELFDASDSKEDILYHYTVNFINQNNALFVKPEDIGYSNDRFIELKDKFNQKLLNLIPYYSNRQIIEVNGYYTIGEYYSATKEVISRAIDLCGLKNQQTNNDYDGNVVLSDEQKNILTNVFANSSVALVTGAAGTGKTTLIKEFIKNNPEKSILCLTTTNTANNNLKMKEFTNVTYRNISQFEAAQSHNSHDIIIVDESSFVSTEAIRSILSEYKNSVFLFVGDPEQIESIEFGNWFVLLLKMLKRKNVVYTLDVEHRTNVKEIAKIWNAVRNGKRDDILELLSAFGMTEKMSEDIFKLREGEVVLCLNYDGLYGINNINRYLQASNPNTAYEYQQNLYKVGDPVVFITNDYSLYGIYNNMKGEIVDIEDDEENITFTIELFNDVDEGRLSSEINILREDSKCLAVVKKMKYYNDKYDSDMDSRTKLPFQISYAMSIHKAQGLEFDSVKIVITKESDEQITKNIFYTAVTRAKSNLKIYWEPEVADYVLNNIENATNFKNIDLSVLEQQFKDRI